MLPHLFRSSLVVLACLTLLAWVVLPSQGTCAGSSVDPTTGLACLGECDPATDACAAKQTTGPINGHPGSNTYQYCACRGGAEPACCHLVAYKNWLGTWVAGTNGQCPPCPLTGTCELINGQASCQ